METALTSAVWLLNSPAKGLVFLFSAALLALRFLLLPALAEGGIRIISVEGTSFKVEFENGRVLGSPDLVGSVFPVTLRGKNLQLRIDTVAEDRGVPGGPVLLHSFSARGKDGTWAHLCKPGADGLAMGFPLAGRSRDNGTLDVKNPLDFEIACTAGAQAKCVRYGYFPWTKAPDGSPLRKAFDACVLMLRADYAGDNHPTTRDGTKVGVSDRWYIREFALGTAENFEAGWNGEGAICVRKVRIAENITLAQLNQTIPRLQGRTGDICTADYARQHGALILNYSGP